MQNSETIASFVSPFGNSYNYKTVTEFSKSYSTVKSSEQIQRSDIAVKYFCSRLYFHRMHKLLYRSRLVLDRVVLTNPTLHFDHDIRVSQWITNYFSFTFLSVEGRLMTVLHLFSLLLKGASKLLTFHLIIQGFRLKP